MRENKGNKVERSCKKKRQTSHKRTESHFHFDSEMGSFDIPSVSERVSKIFIIFLSVQKQQEFPHTNYMQRGKNKSF